MGIEAKEGERSRQSIYVVAVKARDLKRYDIVHCGDGTVRTVEEVVTLPPVRTGRAEDQTRVSWLATFGYMFVQADELFWTQQFVPFKA